MIPFHLFRGYFCALGYKNKNRNHKQLAELLLELTHSSYQKCRENLETILFRKTKTIRVFMVTHQLTFVALPQSIEYIDPSTIEYVLVSTEFAIPCSCTTMSTMFSIFLMLPLLDTRWRYWILSVVCRELVALNCFFFNYFLVQRHWI